MNRRALLFGGAVMAFAPGIASGASTIKVIYVGGLDCQPCTRWKNTYLQKWRDSPEYRRVDWIEVESPRLKEAYQERFWPGDLKPILDQLPRKGATPRFLIVRNGTVVANRSGSTKWPEMMADLKTILGE